MKLNGVHIDVAPEMRATRLLDYLRSVQGLMGAKEGCGVGECGSCAVVVDGHVQPSCLVLTGQVENAEIRTVEGLEAVGHGGLQRAFVERQAVQCGYCIPGILNACSALLDVNPQPTRDQIAKSMDGNLCRCTAYQGFIDAVLDAAQSRSQSP